jgi:hypothetical protein
MAKVGTDKLGCNPPSKRGCKFIGQQHRSRIEFDVDRRAEGVAASEQRARLDLGDAAFLNSAR